MDAAADAVLIECGHGGLCAGVLPTASSGSALISRCIGARLIRASPALPVTRLFEVNSLGREAEVQREARREFRSLRALLPRDLDVHLP